MPPASYCVQVLDFTVLRELPGSRSAVHYVAMLEAMEVDDTAGMDEAELREMCLMSLQDLEPAEAAAVVLQHDLGQRLKKGQIHNMAQEMVDEKLWEEHADLSLHEQLFTVGSLLHAAFPGVFPEPDAVRVNLEVVATDDAGRAVLAAPLPESFVVRLLADGMDDRAILRRLFDDQLAGQAFPEADRIVWTVNSQRVDADTVRLDIVSSGYWLDPLRETRAYDSAAHADGPAPRE